MSRYRFIAFFPISALGLFFLAGCSEPTSTPAAKPGGSQATAPATAQASQVDQPSAGLSTNLRQAKQRVVDENLLQQFAKMYIQYEIENGHGPTKLEDITGLPAKWVDDLQADGLYVVNWKLRNISGSTIIAYVKEPDAYGTRLVA